MSNEVRQFFLHNKLPKKSIKNLSKAMTKAALPYSGRAAIIIGMRCLRSILA